MKSASKPSTESLRILVLGNLVREPLGGHAWHHLQYVLGLTQLGHDVYFLEESGDSPWCCYDPSSGMNGTDPTYGLQFVENAFRRIGLPERWAYYDAHTSCWSGPGAGMAEDRAAASDILLNVSHVNELRPWLMRVPVRVLVDTDPVFTQIEHLTNPAARSRSLRHNMFFTFGANIGAARSAVPDDGLPWLPTRQPVFLDAWPVTTGPRAGKFTTVMQWQSYPAKEYQGRQYGMKAESFNPYIELPSQTHSAFELSLGGPDAPRSLLSERGWGLSNPLESARDPWTYQEYIRRSKAEFTVAKQGYVSTRCGWFSERSAAYLASGRPVLVQETGFSDWLPVGTGLLAFRSPEEAREGVAEIEAHYEVHCRSARALAEEYFDSRKILSDLIAKCHSPASALQGVSR